MCFRPATAGPGPVKCPGCGETVFPSNGVVLESCPYCSAKLPQGEAAAAAAPGSEAPAAPGAPSVPAAPSAPSAPKSPAMQ